MKMQKGFCYTILFLLFYVISLQQSMAASKYGFAELNKCPLLSLPFPVGFNMTWASMTVYNLNMEVNIIYIVDDDVINIDDYLDLFIVNAVDVWPSGILRGNAIPVCQTSSECQNSKNGTVGKGVTAYKSIAAEFPGENIFVAQQTIKPSANASSYTSFNLPVRAFKLLRIEIFVPNTLTDGIGYSEPFFVEYRASGNKGLLYQTSTGGTAKGANFTGSRLPEYLNPTQVGGLNFNLTHSTSSVIDDVSDLLPSAGTSYLNAKFTLPDTCK